MNKVIRSILTAVSLENDYTIVNDSDIQNCQNLADACNLAMMYSGRSTADIAAEIGINESDISDIPSRSLIPFMVVCRNIIPMQWMILQLTQEKGALTVYQAINDINIKMVHMLEEFKELRASVEQSGDCQFSIAGSNILIPHWLFIELGAAENKIHLNPKGGRHE